MSVLLRLFILFTLSFSCFAGEWPKIFHAYKGKRPTLDGIISEDEYADSSEFSTAEGWTSQFNPVNDINDLSARGWIKHDGVNLYFAIDVADDVLYAIDTDRWLPDENPKAHEFTREGYPWFGDGIELLINTSNKWVRQQDHDPNKSSIFGTVFNAGDGSSWQMICNVTKSRKGGIGTGGLIEGERRDNPVSWENYSKWIDTGSMKAVVKTKCRGKGYIIEWMIKPNPCLEISPGKFWSPDMGSVKMGLNIGIQDLDEKHKGKGNFGHFNHEQWWAGERDKRTQLSQWGTLVIHPKSMPVKCSPETSEKVQLY